MKLLCMIAGLALACSLHNVRGDLLAYEGFDLAQGENGLANAAGATSTGWLGVWSNTAADVTGGLTYSGLDSTGNAAVMDTANAGAFRTLATPMSTGTVWLSFISVVPSNSSYAGVSFFNNFNNELFFVGDLNSRTNWGMQTLGTGGPVLQSQVNTTNQAFLVLRMDINAGITNSENFYLWVNPALGAEPSLASASITMTNVGMLDTPITRMRIQQGGTGDNLVVDEIRVGTTWAAVTVPEPGSALLLLFGAAALRLATARKAVATAASPPRR